MVNRRQMLVASAFAALASSVRAQSRTVRIGLLGPSAFNLSVYASGVVKGFSDLGYREGTTKFEYRSSDGKPELYAKQARELVELKCDLYVAIGTEPSVKAIQQLKPMAPIVFLAIDYDPLERHIISALRRPDRNTTGIYVPQNALVAKRVEILREVFPKARRIGVFADKFSAEQLVAAQRAAEKARFEVTVMQFAAQPYDYQGALDAVRKAEVDALMTLASPLFARDRQQIGGALVRNRMPSIGSASVQAEAGFLLSFAASAAKVTRRVADIGVRLLKGAAAADIPVEQADEFELAVNANTAKALGVRIPESIMARATRIVS